MDDHEFKDYHSRRFCHAIEMLYICNYKMMINDLSMISFIVFRILLSKKIGLDHIKKNYFVLCVKISRIV